MNSVDVLKAGLTNDNDMFLAQLSAYTIVDIGTIQHVTNGRALVHGSAFNGTQQVIYQDAEIIFPGNSGGAYMVECTGSPCLIFMPRSCMLDTVSKNIRLSTPHYDKAGAKVLPICNGTTSTLKTLFSMDGIYSIVSPQYNCVFTENTITVSYNDDSISLNIDEKGCYHIIRQGDNGTYYMDLNEDGVVETWINKDKDVQWVDTLEMDGSRTFTQSNPDAQEGDNPLVSLTISKEGKLTITGAITENIEIKGNAVVKVSDGDAKIDANNIELNGNDKRLVTYAELKTAMDKLWIAMTTTPIAGNGAPQPSWTGITSIDISASETQTIKTGG